MAVDGGLETDGLEHVQVVALVQGLALHVLLEMRALPLDRFERTQVLLMVDAIEPFLVVIKSSRGNLTIVYRALNLTQMDLVGCLRTVKHVLFALIVLRSHWSNETDSFGLFDALNRNRLIAQDLYLFALVVGDVSLWQLG